ncbi:hypothetical protein [Lacrimispora sp. JR3]|uniref:hypothetical protein n=1 Tax=Lacrimispora sinapis TaxID=3111456 RepID=UPI0037480ABB
MIQGRAYAHRAKKVNHIVYVLIFSLTIPFLSGCAANISPEERFSHSEEKGDGYDTYGSFDVRELEEQVEGYWKYYMENEKQKGMRIHDVDRWSSQWIENDQWTREGEYIVGKNINQGLYVFRNKEDVSLNVSVDIYKENVKGERKIQTYWTKPMSFFYLEDGDIVNINRKTEIAPVPIQNYPKMKGNKIYYEGSYIVGKEIPKGEYFVLSMEISVGTALVTDQKDKTLALISRFGYADIEDELAVNLQNCILIPMGQKPTVRPIKYQNPEAAYGETVFAEGMYKVGKDLADGTYRIKNEVYNNLSDLTYKGYHGNESYYPGYYNWCGLIAGNKTQANQFGWSEMQLDSYQESKIRYLKITDSKGEINYKQFEGLPTVTFTEKDIGNNVGLMRCVLIPE